MAKFEPGNNANPRGRPKGAKGKTQRAELLAAISRVEKKKRKTLFAHAIEQCFEDNKLLAAIIKKLVPDMKHIDLETSGDLIVEIVNYAKNVCTCKDKTKCRCSVGAKT